MTNDTNDTIDVDDKTIVEMWATIILGRISCQRAATLFTSEQTLTELAEQVMRDSIASVPTLRPDMRDAIRAEVRESIGRVTTLTTIPASANGTQKG